MPIREDLRVTAVQRSALGAVVAGLGTCFLAAYTWWSARGSVPTPDVSAVIVLLIPIGATAGFVSGRLRDAPFSWAAAAMGSLLAYQLTSVLGPGLPLQDSSFTGHELLDAAFLVPFVGGGHVFGAWARAAAWRRRLGAAIAGLGICSLCLFGWRSYAAYGPGATPTALVWVALASWIGAGVAAGLVSGRAGDAPASWAAAVTGFMVAYLAYYGIEQGSSGPLEILLYVPVVLVAFVAGGHLLGTAIGAVATRSRRHAPV